MTPQAPKSASGRMTLRALWPVITLVGVALFFYAIPPHRPITVFGDGIVPTDVQIMAVHTIIAGTVALGMTLIVLSGGIDLSVGSGVALSGVVGALAINAGGGALGGLIAAIGAGALCGLYNGLLVTVLRLPPFIATLGTLGFFRGLAKVICGGQSQVTAPTLGLESWVRPQPEPSWLFLAPGVWILLALSILMACLIRFTVLGRRAVAIGDNEEAARRCGVPIARTKILVYVVAGALVGLAGLMQFARLTVADPTVQVGLELDVIAGVVIGGASLSGGRGSIAGTLGGIVLMVFLKNRCSGLGWSNSVQEMIVGHIIIIAVAVDQWHVRRGTR